jgi:hypothetical protein
MAMFWHYICRIEKSSFGIMKIALNNQNIILKRFDVGAADCYRCCFCYNLGLCGVLELRDYAICRTVKILDKTELKEVFKL